MAALHKHCPSLGLVGDLKHWDISPPVRRKLIKVGGGKYLIVLRKIFSALQHLQHLPAGGRGSVLLI